MIIKYIFNNCLFNFEKSFVLRGNMSLFDLCEALNTKTNGNKFKNLVKKYLTIIDVNATNEYGSTPLIIATKYSNHIENRKKLIEILIKHDSINLDIQDSDGWTALMIASRDSNSDSTENTVKMLIEAGADLNLQHSDGSTALMIASRSSNTDSTENTVKMLIEAGANLNLQHSDGSTALMIASRYSNTDSTENTVKMLIEAGADLNIQNKKGDSAIRVALYYSDCNSSINTIKILIEAGANLCLSDSNGVDIIELIIEKSKKNEKMLKIFELDKISQLIASLDIEYRQTIKNLQFEKYKNKIFITEQCIICMEDVSISNGIMVLMPCGHTFCTKCCCEERNGCFEKCPLCRSLIKNEYLLAKSGT